MPVAISAHLSFPTLTTQWVIENRASVEMTLRSTLQVRVDEDVVITAVRKISEFKGEQLNRRRRLLSEEERDESGEQRHDDNITPLSGKFRRFVLGSGILFGKLLSDLTRIVFGRTLDHRRFQQSVQQSAGGAEGPGDLFHTSESDQDQHSESFDEQTAERRLQVSDLDKAGVRIDYVLGLKDLARIDGIREVIASLASPSGANNPLMTQFVETLDMELAKSGKEPVKLDPSTDLAFGASTLEKNLLAKTVTITTTAWQALTFDQISTVAPTQEQSPRDDDQDDTQAVLILGRRRKIFPRTRTQLVGTPSVLAPPHCTMHA